MSKTTHAVGASLAVLAACLFVPLAASSAGPPDAVCPSDTFTFTGTARDLVVPTGASARSPVRRSPATWSCGTAPARTCRRRASAGTLPSARRQGRTSRSRPSAGTSSPAGPIRAPASSTRRSATTSSVGRPVRCRHPELDGRARRAADGIGRRAASRERRDRARPLRVEAADDADRAQLAGHAGGPGQRRS